MKLPDPTVLEKVKQWLAYAEEDLGVARHAFSMPELPSYRLIAFHAQQCAEKHLKAYLVFTGSIFHSRMISGGYCTCVPVWRPGPGY